MSKRPWIVEAIESPAKHPFIFIFVITLALAVAGNGLSNLILDNLCTWLEEHSQFTKASWQGLLVIILISSIALSSTNLAAIWSRFIGQTIPYSSKVRPLAPTETVKGLIVFMSLSVESPAKTAILHHWQDGHGKLEHCWLICGGTPSLDKAKELVEQLITVHKLPTRTFHYGTSYKYPNPDNIHHPFSLVTDIHLANDPSHIRQLIECIYDSAEESPFSLPKNEIIVDYTGGTKSMTAGAILAGASPERRLQYIVSDYDDKNKPIKPRVMEVNISYQVKPSK